MNIGRYQIIQQLGSGAMGAVYKARDPMMGRDVAIKTILPQAIEGPQSAEFRDRFMREARAAGRLAHPGIVTVYDVSEHEGTPFLVMEFVEGRTLDATLKAGEPMDFKQVCDLGIQLAEALDYAHQNGVIHRDIKPSNILIDAGGRLKVTDFGIARLIDSQATSTGQFLGTPSFMAPEQFAGGPIDGRADLFATGVVMYRMTTRDAPFAGDSLVAVQYKVIHTDPVPPRRLNPAIPRGLEAVILRCMAKDPAERYQSGRELAGDLAGVRDGAIRPVLARDVSSDFGDAPTLMTGKQTAVPVVRSRTARRSIAAVTGLIGLTLILGAAGILRTFTNRSASRVEPPAAAVASVPPQPSPPPSVTTKPVAPPTSTKKVETPNTDAITLELNALDRTNIVFRSEGQPDETLIMKAGDSVTLHAKRKAVLIVTNPSALQGKLNGKPVSLGGRRRASEWLVTPEGLDESLSRLRQGNTTTARGSSLGSTDRQKELAQSPDSVRLLFKSSSVPDFVTLVVRVDNEVLFRRDSTATPPTGFNAVQKLFNTGPVFVVPLAEERLIPSGPHIVYVSATVGYIPVGRAEVRATFDPGQQRTVLIELASAPQRGLGAISRLQATLQ
jgi:serine/threonine-protein kinase